MLPNEFTEKTGIPECYYEQANGMYLLDRSCENNSDFCAKLVRSPKLLIELMHLNAKMWLAKQKELSDEYVRMSKENVASVSTAYENKLTDYRSELAQARAELKAKNKKIEQILSIINEEKYTCWLQSLE